MSWSECVISFPCTKLLAREARKGAEKSARPVHWRILLFAKYCPFTIRNRHILLYATAMISSLGFWRRFTKAIYVLLLIATIITSLCRKFSILKAYILNAEVRDQRLNLFSSYDISISLVVKTSFLLIHRNKDLHSMSVDGWFRFFEICFWYSLYRLITLSHWFLSIFIIRHRHGISSSLHSQVAVSANLSKAISELALFLLCVTEISSVCITNSWSSLNAD